MLGALVSLLNKIEKSTLRLRIFIIETRDAIRESLAMHVESLGHEVIMATSADNCPHYRSDKEHCSQKNACGDAPQKF